MKQTRAPASTFANWRFRYYNWQASRISQPSAGTIPLLSDPFPGWEQGKSSTPHPESYLGNYAGGMVYITPPRKETQ